MRGLGDVSDEVVAGSRPVASRPARVTGVAVLVLVLGAGFAFAALRGPAPEGLAATGWDPPVILAVDPGSPEWQFRSLSYLGDGGVVREPIGLQSSFGSYSLRYQGPAPLGGHRPSLELDVYEATDAVDADGRRQPAQAAAIHSPSQIVEVRGHPAAAKAEPSVHVARVAWWEDDTTLVRLTLRTVPSLRALAAGVEVVAPTVEEAAATADALVEITRDEWLELDRLTQERLAASLAVQATAPEGRAGPVTTMIGR